MAASEAQGRSSRSGGTPAGASSRRGGGGSLRAHGKVLPEHARGHNRSLVLQTLFHEGTMSRADLSRGTGLTRVTISDLVAELISDGFVLEKGVRESSGGPGKPAILVDLARDEHQIIGMDLSGSSPFTGAVLNLDGEVLVRREVPEPASGDADAALALVIRLARELVAAATRPVLGVGVGSPGVVGADGGVLTAPNYGWADVPLRDVLSAELGLPVVVANDANAAVLAECTLGAAEGDCMLVKIGLGVGAGLIIGGEPVIGRHFAAGEIGHVTVGTDGGPPCVCGRDGCLEAWVAVPGLRRRISDSGDRDTVLRDAGERLGIALAPIVGALDLPEVTLSGPRDLLEGPFADSALETLRHRTLAQFHDGVRVRMTEHGSDIVLRGAAVMVLSERLGVS
ncbi:ROK family transcriptional regulator [Microbacterium gorillae]|uniref:ROK family transcriptional regulator n=1 Tax=Microbacterium gorillae TaxID=1231063 RepID=UPI00058CFB46|nr:ROK family transcriptional regulator [Microbacterium gorillae]